MSVELKKTFVTSVFAAAAVLASTSASFAGTCVATGGASQELLDAARNNPARLISSYGSKDAMSDAIRLLVATDTTLAAQVLAAASGPGVSADQKAGMGAGLARAANICEPQNAALATEIQEAVAALAATPADQAANRDLLTAFNSGLGQFATAATGAGAGAAPGAGAAAAPGVTGTGAPTGTGGVVAGADGLGIGQGDGSLSTNASDNARTINTTNTTNTTNSTSTFNTFQTVVSQSPASI